MTLVTIDVSDVASETHPDDKVIFWAPTHRPGTHTAKHAVSLTAGVGEVDLKPGPTMVQFQCRGIADTAPKLGTIPDVGPADLDDVLAGAYHYDPPVVSRVEQLASEVRENLGLARQAVEDVSGQAEQAAEDAATTATEQALATAALYTGTGFPEGKVAAPVGAVYTDTAATAGAVRWIKVSGTGTTGWQVQYGDTGWRSVHASFMASGTVKFKRTGNLVQVKAGDGNFSTFTFVGTSPGWESLIPIGFRPTSLDFLPIRDSLSKEVVGSFMLQTNAVMNPRMSSAFTSKDTVLQTGVLVYTTNDSWPSTLPGTPV